ncbi:MAG: NYN domain-containing protein [Chlorobi bacterium]|nr:NYN domain-containing protein [Chlorobiota bacterium]MCI0715692.1 NYN domain-containing protein [Chlorobiota bacterium]
MEIIIIDAYNLIHKVSELRILLQQSQDICVDTMVSKLHSHYFGRGVKCILVFDGYGKNKHESNIEVKFSKTDVGPDYGHADALIKHLIEKSKNPKLLKVISSDRDITFFAKECGAKIQTAEGFWGEVKDRRIERIEAEHEAKEKPDVVTKTEFDFLLKEFKKK